MISNWTRKPSLLSHLSRITNHYLLSRRARSPVWHKKLLHDCVKTRIAPQGIEDGINSGFERKIVAFFHRFFEPGKGLFLIAQPHVDHQKFCRGDVLTAASSLIQSFEFLL